MATGVFGSVWTYAPGKALLDIANRVPGRVQKGKSLTCDAVTGGVYRLRGTTSIAGSPDIPVSRRVSLYRTKVAARCAREVWSDANGDYTFSAIERGPWVVVAWDHTGEYNAVAADNIYGESM